MDVEPPPATSSQTEPSTGSSLLNLGRTALQPTKRNARLAGLKAEIAKLKRIDLNNAHQTPHSPTTVRGLTLPGAAGAKAIS